MPEKGQWLNKIGQVNWAETSGATDICPGLLEQIKVCLEKEIVFSAHYSAVGSKQPKLHEIHPLGLVHLNRVPYLVCCLNGGDKIFQLRLQRLHSPKIMDKAIKIPARFDLETYIQNGGFNYPLGDQGPIELRLSVQGHAKAHFQNHKCRRNGQNPTQADDDIIILDVEDSHELRKSLLSFGPELKVLEPHDLRAAIHGDEIRDPLTGMFNPGEFRTQMKMLLENPIKQGDSVCLLYIDFDDFKSVNETYNHGIGNQALKYFAEKIRESIRKSDWAFRCGGDEFAVLLPRTTPGEAVETAHRIYEKITASPLNVAGKAKLFISASIGIASTPPLDPSRLIDMADESAKKAKQFKGSGQAHVYHSRESCSIPCIKKTNSK